MLKVMFCLKRLPHLSVQEFQRCWCEIHAPLVWKHRGALKVTRYVQLHTQHGPVAEKLRHFRGSPEPFDGVAEVWYESADALVELGRSQDGRAASRELLEDEKRFVDFSRSPIWPGTEMLIIPVPLESP
jgi:hypothetical protein